MTRSILAVSAVAVSFVACGPQNEDELISDQEIAQMQTAQSALTQAQPAVTPGGFHLRVAWGYLAGNRAARSWVDWTGGVKVDSGAATLDHLIFFERRDFPMPSSDPSQVLWKSRTLPHFDGVVVHVVPGAATDQLHLTTPLFSKDFEVAALAAGTEQRFDVDADGHQVSVSALPDVGCGGFAFGFERPANQGWLGFGGILSDESGNAQGVLRFRADRDAVFARLLGKDKEVLAQGKGTLNGDKFEFTLGAMGTVKGFFQGPSQGSPRGSFQGSLRCP
jgi:hypothetical protein